MKNQKLLIFDGTALVNSAYNATLTKEMEDANKLYDSAKTEEEKENALKVKEEAYKTLLKSTSGNFINAVQLFFKEFFDILDKQNPSHVAICWGTPRATNYKKEIYDGYKKEDKKMDTPLKEQFDTIKNILNKIGVAQYRSEKYEALDIAASIVSKFKDRIPTCIVARNRNSLQLCDESTIWLRTSSREKLSEQYGFDLSHVSEHYMEYDESILEKIYGLNIEEFIDYRAIIGNTSSGIPGVKGVGETTALPLIKFYKSIDSMYSQLNDMVNEDKEEPKKGILKKYTSALREKLGIKRLPLNSIMESEENAKISRQLVKIKKDILIEDKVLDINIDKFVLVKEMKKCSIAKLDISYDDIPSTNFSDLIITFDSSILSPSSEEYIGSCLNDSYIHAVNDNNIEGYKNGIYSVKNFSLSEITSNDYEEESEDEYYDVYYDNTEDYEPSKATSYVTSKKELQVDTMVNESTSNTFKIVEIVTSFKYQCNHCNEYFVTEGKPAKFCPHCGVKNNSAYIDIPVIEKSQCSLSDMAY